MNLKTFLDAANGAEARVQQIAAQIDGLFTEGKTTEALELKPQLDTAKADAKAKGEMYVTMLDISSSGNDPAQRFTHVEVTRDAADQPFASDGEFFRSVKLAAMYPAQEDRRLIPLRVKNATGMSEGVPEDGGYLLQPTVATPLLEKVYSIGEILSRVSRDPVGPNSNSMVYNGVDEKSRVAGSRWGGVLGYWVAEGETITATKSKFWQFELKLKGVAALCYATDEQLQDTTNLASWLGRVVPDELRFQAEDAIVEGVGGGMPLGIMTSPALVEVLRTDASKVQMADINAMWARRKVGLDYIWLINQDVTAQLDGMTAATAPVYLPPGGLSASPYGMLKGRPVIEAEYCHTMGTKGDILLAALSQYQTIDKGSVQEATSIHVAFVTHETAFRFTWRIAGAPSWNSALTPLHGSNTVSPFVALTSASA